MAQLISDRGIRRIFNLTREDSIGNFIGATVFLLLGISSFLASQTAKATPASSLRQKAWLFFALVFCYLALDDAAMIHERVGTVVEDYLRGAKQSANSEVSKEKLGFLHSLASSFPSYYWHLVFAPGLACFGFSLFILIWKTLARPADKRWLILAISILCCSQALDFIEGLSRGFDWISGFTGIGIRTLTHCSKVIEEVLEIIGLSLLLVTVILAGFARSIQVQFIGSNTL